MPRYEKDQVATAKAEGRALFTLAIERKYTLPNHKGGSSTIYGVATPIQLAALKFANDVVHGRCVDIALVNLQNELRVLGSADRQHQFEATEMIGLGMKLQCTHCKCAAIDADNDGTDA